ncbi:MAG: calcium-binding protein, partial [Oscillospiraceae bacterium]|nr:calcium-binding protein [Oscillospiraceae bacterium]
MEYKNESIETLYKHFSDIMNNVDGKYTHKISRTFTDDWNSLPPKLRRQISDYASNIAPGKSAKDNSIADSFNKILRFQAVDDFWANERELLQKGLATYNWDATQQDDILNGIKPKYIDPVTGKKHVFQGHHMADVHTNPEYAGDFRNIQPLYGQAQTPETLHNLAHNGNSKNKTFGYYDNITREMYNFPDSMIEKMFDGVPKIGDTNMFNGFPPIIELTDISVGNGNSIPNAKLIDRMKSVFPGFDQLTNDQKVLVQRYESLWKESGGKGDFIDIIFDNNNILKKNEAYLDDISKILVDYVNFDSFEIPKKYKELLKVSNLDETTSKKLKQLIYMLEVKKVDPKSIDMDDILKDCCPSSSVFDTFRKMQADDVAELMVRNVKNTGGRYTLKGCVTVLTPHDLGIDTWLLENKAKLVKALRDDANLGKIISKGGTVVFTALDLVDFADICGDIYLGLKYNTMTVDEAGEKMFSWGCATLLSEAGAEAGAVIGAAIGSAVLPPLGTIAGGLIGGLCGGTLGYILGQWFGETFYDDLSAGAFNFWDSVLSDGRHFLEGASSDDVLNFAHGEKGQFSIREFFTSPDITDITFDIESKGGNDYISGFQNSDKLVGGSGNDMIIGCGGNDIIYGDEINTVYNESESYDDIIYGGSGEDEIHGGLGNDIIYGDGIENQADATDKDIFWIPKPRNEEEYWMSISGEFENFNPYSDSDTSFGDIISGDEGSDIIYAGLENDTVHGGYDSDIIYGEAGDDKLYGDEGDDFITGGKGSDYIEGGTGDDIIIGGSEDDNDDTVYNGDDTIYGQEGNDTISVNSGSNKIFGGIGKDYIYGGRDNDIIYGDNDTLEDGMNDGDDYINGGAGDDYIYGGGGNDFIEGGSGSDYIYVTSGINTISGGTGIDYIWGGSDSDTINGDNEDDYIYSGAGDDIINGGSGDDHLSG